MLIGITGHARSGKDTVAEYLALTHEFNRVSLAQPLRDMLMTGLGLRADHFEGDVKERSIGWIGRSPREMMQSLGTEWGRALVADDLWLRVAERRIALSGGTRSLNWVISDVRFDNEARWVRRLGGHVWRVLRASAIPVAPHASEHGIDLTLCDATLANDGTVVDLYAGVERLLVPA